MPNRSGQLDHCIEHVNPGPGQSAGRQFLGRKPPLRKPAGDFVAEMRFEMDDLAKIATFDEPRQFAQCRIKALVGADAEDDAGCLAGLDRPHRLRPCQGQRLFAEHMLAG